MWYHVARSPALVLSRTNERRSTRDLKEQKSHLLIVRESLVAVACPTRAELGQLGDTRPVPVQRAEIRPKGMCTLMFSTS